MTNLAIKNDLTATENWLTLCEKSDLIPQAGVCALLDNDEQIALFQLSDDKVYGISNFCPFGQANVLYRGIVGDTADGDIYVASPLHKQRFSLLTGQCLDNDNTQIKVYIGRIVDNQVQVQESQGA